MGQLGLLDDFTLADDDDALFGDVEALGVGNRVKADAIARGDFHVLVDDAAVQLGAAANGTSSIKTQERTSAKLLMRIHDRPPNR